MLKSLVRMRIIGLGVDVRVFFMNQLCVMGFTGPVIEHGIHIRKQVRIPFLKKPTQGFGHDGLVVSCAVDGRSLWFKIHG